MTTDEFSRRVRDRVRELTGEEPIEFDITSFTLGTDPGATDDERVEAIAQSLVRVGEPLERNDRFQFLHPDDGRPALPDEVMGEISTTPILQIIGERENG